MAEMPFVSSLVQEDLPVWQQCLDTEFLRRMEDGTLDEACFKGYIVEDSLYLREYAKVFAWGMTKARTMETLRNYYSLLGFVQESEDVTRLHYLEQFGLSEADLQALPLRPENRRRKCARPSSLCRAPIARNAPECFFRSPVSEKIQIVYY